MQITPKTLAMVQERTVTLNEFMVDETVDRKGKGTLFIRLKGGYSLTISGAEYEQLGQWTDDSLDAFLVAKLGLEPAEE
jgi:hypothetical protein